MSLSLSLSSSDCCGCGGYLVGDIVLLVQENSDNNALFQITDATQINSDIIPEYNVFHYLDPLAVGQSFVGNGPGVGQNILEADCTNDCPDNCTDIVGERQVCIGQNTLNSSSGASEPTPNPKECLLKCDYIEKESPQTQWNQDLDLFENREIQELCRPNPNTNERVKQNSNFINRRVAFFDSGPGNGFLITSLINYRTQYISSTPDTDIVIKINQAERNIYTQSLNPTVQNSNFHVPVRLNIGTSSGTLEYIEAVQGTLTSSSIYWKKNFYPPRAEMGQLEMEFFTYDGTPIPIERTLGFNNQINNKATLLSSSIINSNIINGEFIDYQPNLPPTLTTFTNTPSLAFVTGASNSKSLQDPFNSKLSLYTQRNLSIYFRAQCYQSDNPGITEIIKEMPSSLVEKENTSEGIQIPLASNIELYDPRFGNQDDNQGNQDYENYENYENYEDGEDGEEDSEDEIFY